VSFLFAKIEQLKLGHLVGDGALLPVCP